MPSILTGWPRTAVTYTILLPFYITGLIDFSFFFSKTTNSFRQVKLLCRKLGARVQLPGTAAEVKKERENHFINGKDPGKIYSNPSPLLR